MDEQLEIPGTPAKPITEPVPDEIWDVLTEAFGEVRTPSARGRRNRAVRELREAEATAEEVRTAVAYCQKNFPSASEMAVCMWFSRALYEQDERSDVKSTFLRLLKGGHKP